MYLPIMCDRFSELLVQNIFQEKNVKKISYSSSKYKMQSYSRILKCFYQVIYAI